jgi:hypothetical protein
MAAATKIERVDVCGAEVLVNEFGKEYAAYLCRVTRQTPGGKTAMWHILRRYSDWQRLRDSLPKTGGVLLPEFPAKQLFGSVKPHVMEARRLALRTWIAAVIRAPSLCDSDAVRHWVMPTQDDLDYEREYGDVQLAIHTEQLAQGIEQLDQQLQPQPKSQAQPDPQPRPEPTPPLVATRLSPPESPADPAEQSETELRVSSLSMLQSKIQSLPTVVHAEPAPQLGKIQTPNGAQSDEQISVGEINRSGRLHLKPVGQSATLIARMRTESSQSEGDASVTPACDGRHEYVVAFAPGDDVLSIANDVCKLLREHELCVECVSGPASATSQHFLLVTTSAAQFNQQAERDATYKWTKQNDHLTGKPRKKLFTRSRCEEFAGQYCHAGKLKNEYGTVDFFSATERARMVHSIMDDLRAKDDSCSALLTRVAKMTPYGHITSPQLEQESLIDALSRAGIR